MSKPQTFWDESVDTIQADVRDWISDRTWDAVVVTFLHLPSPDRPPLYRLIRRLLRLDGLLVAEWFRPEQRAEDYTSGGPPDPDMTVTPRSSARTFRRRASCISRRRSRCWWGPAATVRFV